MKGYYYIGLAILVSILIMIFGRDIVPPPPRAKFPPLLDANVTTITRDSEIAAVISECTAHAVDASQMPLMLMGSDADLEREKASFHDAFWMLTVATAAEQDLPSSDTAGRQHVENIRNLFRAYDTEFRKPRIDLDRARRIRRLMELECDDLQALTKKS